MAAGSCSAQPSSQYDLSSVRWQAEQLISVQEGPDGELKFSLLGESQTAASPKVKETRERDALAVSPAAFAVMACAAALFFVLGRCTGLTSGDVVAYAALQEQQAEVSQLISEVKHLRGSIAGLITSSASLSTEQVAALLALRRAGIDTEEKDKSLGSQTESSVLFTSASILAVVALLLPPFLLGWREYNLAAPKVGQDGFNWGEQIEYRIDYYLSNVAGAKTIFLSMITGVLIALGAVVYYPVENMGLGGSQTGDASLHQSLWMAWCFVADPGTHADQVWMLIFDNVRLIFDSDAGGVKLVVI